MKNKIIQFAAIAMVFSAAGFVSCSQDDLEQQAVPTTGIETRAPVVYPDWTGPMDVEATNQMQYTASLPNGTTFVNWEISPVSSSTLPYYTIYSPTSPTTMISFTALGQYYLKANFNIAGVGPYSVQKIVHSHIPFNYYYPEIELQNLGSGRVQASITNISDYYFNNCDYVEWEINGQISTSTSYSPIYITNWSGRLEVKFRLIWGSRSSGQGFATL